MADVFISYARADEAFAERLAKRLEALGLSVWWDRRLLPGDDWELAIEEAIDAAKAVIVIWSQESVRSKPVRAEARRADRRDKLVPIAIETVEPPLFSSGVHFEDFSDWTDDTAALEFQDLWRQLIALRDDAAAASLVPRDGETPIAPLPGANAAPTPGAAGLDPDAPVLKASWLNRPIGPFSSFAKLLEFAVAIGGVAWLFINRENLIGTYWNAVVSAAIFFVVMFNAAESSLSRNVKAVVAQWLRPQPKAPLLRAAQAFLAMFEAVFGKRHVSLRCIGASAFASVALYLALLLLFVPMEILQQGAQRLIETGPQPLTPTQDRGFTYVTVTFLETNAALLFLAIPLANILVDYVSLGQTRLILRWAARGLSTPLAVLLDALLTGALFVALLPLGPVAFALGYEALSGGVTPDGAARARLLAEEIWRSLWVFVTVGFPSELISAVAGEASVTNTALLIAFLTTFTTSAWLWSALIFSPLVRLLSWGRRRGLSVLGAVLNTRARPIAPLGYVSAALIFAGAGTSAAISQFAVAGVLTTSDQPFAVFRDCPDCPEMVALPGGVFTMGSPETEAGPFGDEGPQRPVTIAPFAIGRFEVTFREWDRCVAETRRLPDAERCRPIPRYGDPSNGDGGWGRGLRPVITVSWEDIKPFIAWLNAKVADKGVVYRLPSEAEWEYAARGGTSTPYSFQGDRETVGCGFMNGADASALRLNPEWTALACDDGYPFTAPVGSYAANPFSLHDMHGNVWEWVEDCWHGGYEGGPTDGSAWMEPDGGDCSVAVIRGGSWSGTPLYPRSAVRSGVQRDDRFYDIGFRVARTHRGR